MAVVLDPFAWPLAGTSLFLPFDSTMFSNAVKGSRNRSLAGTVPKGSVGNPWHEYRRRDGHWKRVPIDLESLHLYSYASCLNCPGFNHPTVKDASNEFDAEKWIRSETGQKWLGACFCLIRPSSQSPTKGSKYSRAFQTFVLLELHNLHTAPYFWRLSLLNWRHKVLAEDTVHHSRWH